MPTSSAIVLSCPPRAREACEELIALAYDLAGFRNACHDSLCAVFWVTHIHIQHLPKLPKIIRVSARRASRMTLATLFILWIARFVCYMTIS